MNSPDFYINPKFLVTENYTETRSTLSNPESPTPNDLIKVLREEHIFTITSAKDHEEFAKLRDTLENLGYIKTERTWWNGDVVLKPFVLNRVIFKTGDKFLSATAMKYHLKYELMKQGVDISLYII